MRGKCSANLGSYLHDTHFGQAYLPHTGRLHRSHSVAVALHLDLAVDPRLDHWRSCWRRQILCLVRAYCSLLQPLRLCMQRTLHGTAWPEGIQWPCQRAERHLATTCWQPGWYTGRRSIKGREKIEEQQKKSRKWRDNRRNDQTRQRKHDERVKRSSTASSTSRRHLTA